MPNTVSRTQSKTLRTFHNIESDVLLIFEIMSVHNIKSLGTVSRGKTTLSKSRFQWCDFNMCEARDSALTHAHFRDGFLRQVGFLNTRHRPEWSSGWITILIGCNYDQSLTCCRNWLCCTARGARQPLPAMTPSSSCPLDATTSSTSSWLVTGLTMSQSTSALSGTDHASFNITVSSAYITEYMSCSRD